MLDRCLFLPMRRLAQLGCLLAAAGTLGAAADLRLREDYWRDPTFVARFQASYGVNSALEPMISVAERAVFDQIAPLLASQPASAVPVLRAAITPQSSAALDFVLANVYFEIGRFDEAAATYAEALRKFPDFLRAHQFLGKLEVRRGNHQLALPHFVRSMELGGVSGDVLGLMGYCHLALNHVASALVAYQQAVLLQPNSLDWKRGLAQALFQAGKAQDAIAVLDELIVSRPDDADLWLVQANAFLSLGQYTDVAGNWEVVRRLGKGSPEMLVQLGDLYMNEGLQTLAFGVYEQALQAVGDGPPRLPLRMAEVLVNRGDPDRAAAFVTQVEARYGASLQGADARTLRSLQARLAQSRGDYDAAERALLGIQRSDPVYGPAFLDLGMLYAEQGKFVEAALQFEAAALLPDTAADALLRHGEMLVQQGRYRDALGLLRRSLQLRPRDSVQQYADLVERAANATDRR